MIDKSKIEEIVAAKIAGSELFVVEINCSVHNEIEVFVDSDNYLTIDQCAQLSKAIEGELDREVEDFELTVSSWGIGQPLRVERQYVKTIGRPVEVVLRSGGKLTGVLVGADAVGIDLEYQIKETVEGRKRKELVTRRDRLVLDQIKSVREELTIK